MTIKSKKNPPKQWRIQSLGFKKGDWTLSQAKEWLKSNKSFKGGRGQQTKKLWRFPQEEAKNFSKFRVFPIGDESEGINATYGQPRIAKKTRRNPCKGAGVKLPGSRPTAPKKTKKKSKPRKQARSSIKQRRSSIETFDPSVFANPKLKGIRKTSLLGSVDKPYAYKHVGDRKYYNWKTGYPIKNFYGFYVLFPGDKIKVTYKRAGKRCHVWAGHFEGTVPSKPKRKAPAKANNPKKSKPTTRTPAVLVYLGYLYKIKYIDLKGKVKTLEFPEFSKAGLSGSRHRLLTANTAGKMLFVLPNKQGSWSEKPPRIAMDIKAGKKLHSKWSMAKGTADYLLDRPTITAWNRLGYIIGLWYESDKFKVSKATGRRLLRSKYVDLVLYKHRFAAAALVKLYKGKGAANVFKINPVWITEAGIRDPA